MPPKDRTAWLRSDAKSLALALLAIAATTLISLALTPLVKHKAALIMYFPVHVFSAWIGGWAGGLVSLAVSAFAATYLSWRVEGPWL